MYLSEDNDCEAMGETLNSPQVWAASAAILHKLTAVIQLDSNRLHSSSLLLVCWEGNSYTIRAGLSSRCENLPVQRRSVDVPLCADCWWVAGMNLPLRRSFSPGRLNIFSGRRFVHKQPVKEFRTDVCQIFFFSEFGFYRHNFRRPAYLWIVRKSIGKGVGVLRQESVGTASEERGCSSDQGGVRQLFGLKLVREEIIVVSTSN